MKIAVICAEEAEIGSLFSHRACSRDTVGGFPVVSLGANGNELVVIMSGIGKASAAAAAQLAISHFHCEAIINVGLAGNCSALPLGGAVVADRLVYHDFSMDFAALSAPFAKEYIPDSRLSALAEEELSALGIERLTGPVASGDAFIGDAAVKQDIVERTGCLCVEMEAAAIAHTAQRGGAPFAIIKFMSDNADESGHEQYLNTLTIGDCRDRAAELVWGMANRL